MKERHLSRPLAWLLSLLFVCAWPPQDGYAKRRKKSKGPKVLVIEKTFRSKIRFGRKKTHKKRGKWIKIASIKARNKLMAETLGKRIPILCRLTKADQFECKGRTASGIDFATESASWPAGHMKVKILVQSHGISLELSNKWKKHIRTKRYLIKK